MKTENNKNYYVEIKDKMIKDFDKMFQCTRQALEQHFNQSKIEQLYQASKEEFINLLPQVPYIGGLKNKLTMNLIGGAIVLAVIKPLEKEGLTIREIGKVIYTTFALYVQAMPIPRCLRWLFNKLAFASFSLKKARKQAEESLFRKYSGDFVTEFVEGDGEDFDFGIDYIECAIHKLYQEQGAEKYLQYVCLGDYPMFQALGIGFSRTQTIGSGGHKCDARFKRGGKTANGWPPEELAEWREIEPTK